MKQNAGAHENNINWMKHYYMNIDSDNTSYHHDLAQSARTVEYTDTITAEGKTPRQRVSYIWH